MAKKNHQKRSNGACEKVLDTDDPFDQLIMELAQKGILDVSAVEIQESPASETQEYSKKSLPHRGKHISQ